MTSNFFLNLVKRSSPLNIRLKKRFFLNSYVIHYFSEFNSFSIKCRYVVFISEQCARKVNLFCLDMFFDIELNIVLIHFINLSIRRAVLD